MMNKRNLKRAIAKFEEIAADEDYEGNHKIINLDKFLKSDLSKKKKKKQDHLESTPIKCNTDQQPAESFLNNTFDDSSSEVKTADEFLKRFISQPPLEEVKAKKKTTNKSVSLLADRPKKNAVNKSTTLNSKQSASKTANKSTNQTAHRSPDQSSITASFKTTPSSNKSLNQYGKQLRMPKQSKELEEDKRQGDRKLKELEKQFMSRLQQQRSIEEESDEYDEEYDELDDEELDDEELDDEELDADDEELDDEELDYGAQLNEEADEELDERQLNDEKRSDESLDDESIDPESSGLINEQHLNESLDDESKSIDDDNVQLMNEEEFMDEMKRNQSSRRMYQSRSNSNSRQQSRALCRVNRKRNDYEHSFEYITNFEYQRSATEELYNLILKEEDCSFNILTRLIENIKRTLDQDELPNPMGVKPFFHFTSDNQIHATFLFINPKDVYHNPWESIISKNYSNLNILFEKIYELVFNFHCLLKKRKVH